MYVEQMNRFFNETVIFLLYHYAFVEYYCINAFDLRETEFYGSKQDPYVIVRSDMDTRQTRVNMDGGRNPGSFWGAEWFLVWNEVLTVSYNNPTANLEFTMCVSISSVIFRMNKNMMRDMLIGRATYSISQVLASGYAG